MAKGTGERISKALSELPDNVREAVDIYKQVQQFEAYRSKLSVLDQASIPEQDVNRNQQRQMRLEELLSASNMTERDLHNTLQQITWDASADAKAARALMGKMPDQIERRVDNACDIIASAALNPKNDRVLDVGCGPGFLVEYLEKAGVRREQITGIDLSPEMIRNAQESYRAGRFVAGDFLEFQDQDGFDGIVFCSALHDLPDQTAALEKAASLLRPGGTLVILHAQGASHVIGQVKANPVMVKRSLPTAEELDAMQLGLKLDIAPADAGSAEEASVGYLAVLKKTG